LDREVRPLHRRMEISDRGRMAAAVLGGHLEEADPFLVAVVQIRFVRNARLDTGFNQRGGDRMLVGKVRHIERTTLAVEFVFSTLLILALAEVWQHLVPAPPARAHLRPAIVIRRLTADIEHAVDRRRTTKHLALGPLVLGGSSSRSEEHTSELQSRENLVCRLLLEKKKKRTRQLHAASQQAQAAI